MLKPIARLFLIVVVPLLSCTSEVAEIGGTPILVPFKYQKDMVDSPFEQIKDIQAIPLETNAASSIVSINKILSQGNRLFFHDFAEDLILVFDDQGNFIQKVGSQGKGPGEYLEARDMAFNEDLAEFYMLDYKRIHTFDLRSLEYKFSFSVDFDEQPFYNPVSFCNVGDNEFIFWNISPDTWNIDEVEGYNLIHFVNGEYSYYYPFAGTKDIYTLRFTETTEKNKYLIRPPMGDFTIVQWENGSPSLKYHLQVLSPVPKDIISLQPGSSADEVSKTDHDQMVRKVLETKDLVYFSVRGARGKAYEGFYDKAKGAFITGIGKYHPDFPEVMYSDNDYFYGYLFPDKMIERYEKRESLPDFNPLFYSKVNIEEIDPSMNPILYKFSLKH